MNAPNQNTQPKGKGLIITGMVLLVITLGLWIILRTLTAATSQETSSPSSLRAPQGKPEEKTAEQRPATLNARDLEDELNSFEKDIYRL